VKAKKITTVAALARLQRPQHVQAKSGRIPPVEETIYTVHAKLLLYRLESDGDYYVVIQDLMTDSTLITEIPDPREVADGSPWKAQIEQARSVFESQFHPTSSRRNGGRVPITVEGVGFFDKRHDATGAAGNGIEFHPVLWIHVGS
jgi:catechol 2,3-dioxygenase-like lactoylglutathione lyase family enzyme